MRRDVGRSLDRLATWSLHHHWPALAMWLVALLAITAASTAVGSSYHDDHSMPGTESQQVSNALTRDSGAHRAATVRIVLHDAGGLTSSPVRKRVATIRSRVTALDFVENVTDPYEERGAISADRETAYANVTLTTPPEQTEPADVRRLVDTAKHAQGDGLQVELGGEAVRSATEPGGSSEGIGMVAALLILVPLFGSVLAAGLPLITAVFAVGSTVGLIALVSHLATVPSYAAPMMMLVGLGVGIDYALLIFSRFRGELLQGGDRHDAARTALSTAGRSVVFAGCTVIVALLGLLTLGIGELQGLALSVALTVLATMAASVTLLPALLRLFGRRLERSVRKRAARSRRRHGERWRRGDGWRGVAHAVQRRPVPALVGSLLVLLLLAAPALTMRLGFADAGTDPPDSTSRKAYDLLAEGFGPGTNGPLIVLARADRSAASQAAGELRGTDDVARVVGPMPVDDDTYSMVVVPASGPASDRTSGLVHTLRGSTLPRIGDDVGGTYLVGGSTAAMIDFSDIVSTRVAYFIGSVVLLSTILLTAVFRSVLIPLKAALLNLLSIGAAMGAMTYVFGDGHFGAQPGPIEAFLPVVVFAVVFGLSMDYEVFLVSRIHEEWRRHGDPVRAVREGLATTGGVITAAAAIMVVVFGAFLASPDRMLQQMGLGLAVAVLVDALVIRCLLVPAVLQLLGRWAWWLPRRLDRLLPRIRLEREEHLAESNRKEVGVR